MATYKVIQDIEAEDKLVGPLTLRQFIYAAIAAICGYISFLGISKGASIILVVFLPIMAISGFFAFPWKGDQPTEIWALARLRFAIKPRRRIWDQTGIKDYVTITVPKKIEVHYTNGLNQDEVTNRLHTLADVIDSRGWATRNAQYDALAAQQQMSSDRLVDGSTLPQTVGTPDSITASEDMLDEQSAMAQNIDSQLDKSTSDHRKRVIQQMSDAQKPAAAPPAQGQVVGPTLPKPVMPAGQQPAAAPPLDTSWFMNDPAANGQAAQVVVPGATLQPAVAAEPTEEEKALAEQFKEQNQVAQQISYGHLHVVQPLGTDGKPVQGVPTPAKPIIDYKDSKELDPEVAKQKALAEQARKRAEAAVTHQPDPAIIELANNDDEDIATLARRANKEIRKTPDEVEIRLH